MRPCCSSARARRAVALRHARLHDLINAGAFPAERRGLGMTVDDASSASTSAGAVRDPRHRVRRRDEEGRLHDHELPDAAAGRALDALLGERRRRPATPSLFFGLSGTGKTTLSADPERRLIGDDEHGWPTTASSTSRAAATPRCIDLSHETRAARSWTRSASARCWRTWSSIRPTAHVDYDDSAASPRTRGRPTRSSSFRNAELPGVGGHPKDVIFLTCDAFGVLPPVAG